MRRRLRLHQRSNMRESVSFQDFILVNRRAFMGEQIIRDMHYSTDMYKIFAILKKSVSISSTAFYLPSQPQSRFYPQRSYHHDPGEDQCLWIYRLSPGVSHTPSVMNMTEMRWMNPDCGMSYRDGIGNPLRSQVGWCLDWFGSGGDKKCMVERIVITVNVIPYTTKMNSNLCSNRGKQSLNTHAIVFGKTYYTL